MERLTLLAESPLRRLVGSGRLNPLPHAGTISVFLLIVITVTGLYLTMFFEFGFAASYEAVARIEAQGVQRMVRGVHRLAASALVVTTMVHGWRILVASRFSGPRRWRWMSGVAALGIVFLAGVTGYWLVFDVRAQAINEAFARLAGVVSARWEVAMTTPLGAGVMTAVSLWAAHLLLASLVALAVWRHVRRSRHPTLPSRRWATFMGAALVAVAVADPAGMLAPFDPTRAPADMPIDPFLLFLIPPLSVASPFPVIEAVIGLGLLAALLPWLVRDAAPVASVVEERCTGCQLCVVDCPYFAIEMIEDPSVARVDPARCVGCGICVGSCSYDAISGFGNMDERLPSPSDERSLVMACDRHVRNAEVGDGIRIIDVRCVGALSPRSLSALVARGRAVQVVGCPPGDCAYGEGNVLASARLARRRSPFLPKPREGLVSQDWVAPGDLAKAITCPGSHSEVDGRSASFEWKRLVPAAFVVLVSVVAVRLATDAHFVPSSGEPLLRVAVDHLPGSTLIASNHPTSGVPSAVEVTVDGQVRRTELRSDIGPLEALVDIPLPTGPADVRVILVEGAFRTVIHDGTVDVAVGQRLVVRAVDAPDEPIDGQDPAPAPDAQAGQMRPIDADRTANRPVAATAPSPSANQ